MSKQPSAQWWTINGQVLLDALHRAHDGDDPEVVYLELFANSDTVDVEGEDDAS